MARPLRYEAPGAVYHVMARGDGGKLVFGNDQDRWAWLELLGLCCGRFGWRVHAWVLMGNHFHVLLETPNPNLVAGMKWLLGVFSQGWNRRRDRKGHVFQGRYKAVIVNGEESDGYYFRVVADYIHLNPVRSGWVGGQTGKRLRSWRWSSLAGYGGGKKPHWLETGRVLEAFRLSTDARGGKAYCSYLEARALDKKTVVSDVALKELRRGWYLGDEGFAKRVLGALGGGISAKRRRGSIGGRAANAHGESEAERIASAGLGLLKLAEDQLAGRGKWLAEKSLLAALIRQCTGVRNGWVAERLVMGHEGNVTRAVRRVREDGALTKRLAKLRQMLEIRD